MPASLDGVTFNIDPTSVKWSYDIHIADQRFIGGKVAQIYGASISDIEVAGTFGSGGWQEQLKMLDRIKEMSNHFWDHPTADPFRFFWPEYGWDFRVWIKGFTNPDGSLPVVYRNSIIAPKWRLTLRPVSGTDTLKEASITKYIDRLRAGLGWQLTSYNGSMDFTEAQNAMMKVGASSIEEFSKIAFGFGTIPNNPAISDPTTLSGLDYSANGGVLTIAQALRVANSAGFPSNALVTIVAIGKAESGLNTNAHNGDRSTGDDSWGIWQINLLAHGDKFGSSSDLVLPDRNAAAAYALYVGRGQKFIDWSAFKNGAYLKYMNEVDAVAQSIGLG